MRGSYLIPTATLAGLLEQADRLGYLVTVEPMAGERETHVLVRDDPTRDQLCIVCEANPVEPKTSHCAASACVSEYMTT